MGDYESRLYDVQLDFSSLCDRINRRDASLCDEDWCGITNNFDLGWIEAVYKNIKVDDMFDVVTELICRQYSTMVAKGLIDDSIPHINEAGMVIDYPEYYLNKLRDDIRSQRTAEELERKTRHELKQKMMQIKKDEEVRTLQTSIHFDANDVHDVEERNNNVDFTEDLANSIDWVKLTHNFDLDRIKDIVNTFGKTPRDKKIIVKAIYDAMTHTGNMYKIPYHVDKLLDDLYRKYDKNHKGLFDAYNEKTETLNLNVMMKQAIEEYMATHTATDADIDEIFADDNNPIESPSTEEEEPGENLSSTDQFIINAVEIMKKEKVIKHLYDYAFIMQIMNEIDELPTFSSPKSFLNYFKELKITGLPGEDSIKKKVN